MKYQVLDWIIESELKLPIVESQSDESVDFWVRISPLTKWKKSTPDWDHIWLDENGDVDIRLAKLDGVYYLDFNSAGAFQINLTTREIVCDCDEVPVNTTQHLLLDQVLPRVRSHLGALVLHASAVVLPDGSGLMFMGDSGAGKSTMAAYFVTQGARLISDDCVLVSFHSEVMSVIGCYPGVRLYGDVIDALGLESDAAERVSHYSNKRRLNWSDQDEPALVNVTAVVNLISHDHESEQNVMTINTAPTDRIVKLVGQSFLMDPTDEAELKTQFGRCALAARSKTAFCDLHYPHDEHYLGKVKDQLADAINAWNLSG